MTSALAKVALATLLATLSALSLVGLSGMIIFSDLKAPQPSEIAREALNSTSAPSVISGTGR